MFTVRTSFLSLCLSLCLGCATIACGGADTGDDEATAGEESSSQDELRTTDLTGTYDVGIGTGNAFDFDKLTLKANHTFTATARCASAGAGAAHCMSIRQLSGTWSATSSGTQGAAKIVFKATDHSTTTLFYSLSGPILRLSATHHGKFSLFFKAGVAFPKVGVGDVCSDELGNIIAACPDNFACNFDGDQSDNLQRCFPDF